MPPDTTQRLTALLRRHRVLDMPALQLVFPHGSRRSIIRDLVAVDYVAIVCDGKGPGHLADQFRVLDDSCPVTPVSPTEPTSPETAALPLSDRRLVQQPVFHELLATSSLAQSATR